MLAVMLNLPTDHSTSQSTAKAYRASSRIYSLCCASQKTTGHQRCFCCCFTLCNSARDLRTLEEQRNSSAIHADLTLPRRPSKASPQISLQVAIVCLGLALQGLAPKPALAAGLSTAATPAPSSGWSLRLLGVACMLLSSTAYSFLGVSYDLLVRSEGPTPTHSEVMFYTAKIGMCLVDWMPPFFVGDTQLALCPSPQHPCMFALQCPGVQLYMSGLLDKLQAARPQQLRLPFL